MHLESSRAPASKSEYLLEVVYAQAAFDAGALAGELGQKEKMLACSEQDFQSLLIPLRSLCNYQPLQGVE